MQLTKYDVLYEDSAIDKEIYDFASRNKAFKNIENHWVKIAHNKSTSTSTSVHQHNWETN